VLSWRRRFRERLDRIAARYPPRVAVDLDDLADMLSAVVDGGIILWKVLKDKDALPRQVMLYREFVRTVFVGTGSRSVSPSRQAVARAQIATCVPTSTTRSVGIWK
jgi:hypothetical protein